jgi:ADP-heptose:LPS heptosyltransferase
MKLEQPVTILLRRQGALGDVILTTGIVRELYAKYQGQCQIDIATDFGEVFNNNPYVHCVHHTSQIPDVNYNIVINLDDTYEINPNVSFIDNYNFRVFSNTTVDGAMELYCTDEIVDAVDELIEKVIVTDFICIHMRNWHWAMKNIDIAVWLGVIDKILTHNPTTKIVCIGGATDHFPEGHPRIVDARGLTIQGLSYLLDHARCFVGIDSAPFHVAGTSETHIVALLSHMFPEKVLPIREGNQGHNCTVVQAKVPCLGCHSRQQRPVRQIVCEQGDYPCNRLWDVDEIANAIIAQL